MGFSTDIKDKAMHACARHCCVCHRYKGVKIELHHILPKKSGGEDSFENAIPLCFDCHSDAGHYYAKHPKGTKYSPTELKAARENWYKYVENNQMVEKNILSEHIHTSYYILHSFDVQEEILFANNFSSINKFRNRVHLSKNEVSSFWEKLLTAHQKDYGSYDQSLLIRLRQFQNEEEYYSTYPDAVPVDKTSTDFPYYQAKRELEWEKIINNITPNTFLETISTSLANSTKCISLLYKHDNECGGDSSIEYIEYIQIPPISFVFIGITNISKEQIKLGYLKAVSNDLNNFSKVPLPNFAILPHEMVLIPISTHINAKCINENSIILESDGNDRQEDFAKVLNTSNSNEAPTLISNALSVRSIIYSNNEGEYEVPIHELDFNNIYSINRHWECGSCPHLFYILENGQQEYQKEILKRASNGRMAKEEFIIPIGVTKISIKELEDEITHLDTITINSVSTLKNKNLRKGDEITFSVSEGDKVYIKGFYTPFNVKNEHPNDLWYRNNIIKSANREFIDKNRFPIEFNKLLFNR